MRFARFSCKVDIITSTFNIFQLIMDLLRLSLRRLDATLQIVRELYI